MRRAIFAAACATALSACATVAPPDASVCAVGEPKIQTQLYFGLSTAKGVVDAGAWRRFVVREIAPRLPEGFTIVDAQGAWLSEKAGRTIFEGSKVLIRIHDGAPDEQRALGEIVARYKHAFDQESVLRVDANVCAAF